MEEAKRTTTSINANLESTKLDKRALNEKDTAKYRSIVGSVL